MFSRERKAVTLVNIIAKAHEKSKVFLMKTDSNTFIKEKILERFLRTFEMHPLTKLYLLNSC